MVFVHAKQQSRQSVPSITTYRTPLNYREIILQDSNSLKNNLLAIYREANQTAYGVIAIDFHWNALIEF
jgi:hypothetical protein